EDGSVHVDGKPRITLKAGKYFDGWLEAEVADNAINSFTVDGKFGESPLWTTASLKELKYDVASGKITGFVKATLKSLGVVDSGASITVGQKDDELTAYAENVAFTTGKLKGWVLSGGLVGGKFQGSVTAPAAGLTLGPVTVKLDAGSTLSYSEDKGFSGDVGGTIGFKSSTIHLKVTFAGGDISDVKADADIDIKQLIPALSGNLKVGYDKSAADPITIEGKDITATDPNIAKYCKVEHVLYKDGKL